MLVLSVAATAVSTGTLLWPTEVSAAVEVNPLKVVLIGDSYAAGNGARDADGDRNYEGPSGCYRSPTNWSSQYAKHLQEAGYKVTLVNRACSGGVTADYTARRFMDDRTVVVPLAASASQPSVTQAALAGPCTTKYKGDEVWTADYLGYEATVGGHLVTCQRWLEPQINAVDQDTDLVLMTGGGNDVNFAEIIKQCFAPGYRDPGDCRTNVQAATLGLEDVENSLVDVFAAVRAKGRADIRVAFVGYPFLANNDDFELVYRRAGIWESDRYDAARQVRELGRTGDARQQRAVSRANASAGEDFVEFVQADDTSLKQVFTGHEPKPELGTGNPDRWMNEIEQRILIENYHYNPLGHENLAAWLGRGGAYGATGGAADGRSSVDLALVVDTTGSMGDDIAAVQASANAVLAQLEESTQSYRVAVVDYRDFPGRTSSPGDYPAKVVLDFSSNAEDIRAAVSGLTLGNGGDAPETMWSGLMTAFSLDWRPGVKKVALQFGDAPALDPEPTTGYTAQSVIDASLAVDPVAVYAVDTGDAGTAIAEVASATGGEVLRAPTTDQIAGRLRQVIESAVAAPYVWVGSGYTAKRGDAITFDASGSYDSDGQIVSWDWDLDGDGEYETATDGPLLTHTYTGDYEGLVALRVTDDSGNLGLGSAPVTVSADGDELAGDDDNCPDVGNPGQEDEDGDGTGDLCDVDWVLPTQDAPGVGTATGPPPSVVLTAAPYSGEVGRPIAVGGSVADPLGDVVTPTWYVDEACTVADPHALDTTVTCPLEGTYSLALVGDDSNGGVVAAETSITVGPAGETYTFEGFQHPIADGVLARKQVPALVNIRWRLTGADGAPVVDVASFVGMTYQVATCSSRTVSGPVLTAESPSGVRLLGRAVWQYGWKVPKSLSGLCAVVTLELDDRVANGHPFFADFRTGKGRRPC